MELADNLVDSYDVIDVLTVLTDRCVEAFDVSAAGIMLAQPGGELQVVASSSESMRVLELFQIQANEGPCVECFTSGTAIINYTLTESDTRWPHFTPIAIDRGFHSVHCLPMRLRGRRIGCLNLFRDEAGVLEESDVVAAQSLADIATIAILQHRTSVNAKLLNDQLENALQSRIAIEQAKGMVAQNGRCSMDAAFGRLRAHARNRNLRLTDVASMVVSGAITLTDLAYPKAAPAP